ncbi:hypothetical protein IP84_16755 [beta proteobacterium AAP99]|nr:hypothetical protein IP84_16755 [beta proteobacterium AAP99]
MDRRTFLHHSAALAASATLLAPARAAHPEDPRLVFLLLRGGLDGLWAVPALNDPAFAVARGSLAQYPGTPLPLAEGFALHPSLTQMHGLWQAGELSVLHAVATPYRDRSHFDAQNLLETGGAAPFALRDGWMNRTAQALASGSGRSGLGTEHPLAVALSPAIPLVLQGDAAVTNWSAARLSALPDDTLARLARMYGAHPALATPLAQAREASDVMAAASMPKPNADSSGTRSMGVNGREIAESLAPANNALPALAAQAARFLAAPEGPRLAVIESTGWDSHAAQAIPQAQLARNLGLLDQALAQLKQQLGPVWSRTVVLVATEFGRTVAPNGTGGTDHGNGTVAFVAGGAVRGGRLHTDWPGLAPAQLLDGRDLRPTTDLRVVLASLLADHLKIGSAALRERVLPGVTPSSAWAGRLIA